MATYADYERCEGQRLKCMEKYQFCQTLRRQVKSELECEAKRKLRDAYNEYWQHWRGKDADSFGEKVKELYQEFQSISDEFQNGILQDEKYCEEQYYIWQSKAQQCEREMDDAGKAQLTLHRATDGLLGVKSEKVK